MVDLMVTYLEMTAAPAGAPKSSPLPGFMIEQARMKRLEYVTLYRRVGEPFQWDQRLRMEPEALEGHLSDPSTYVYLLRNGDEAVGLCEFTGVGQEDVELANFGLAPEMQGKGLGGFLLDGALRSCWRHSPKRIWLRTDTNDHPNAVAVYRKAGFKPSLRRVESFPD